MKISPQVLAFLIKPEVWLFHVVVLQMTAKKWTKVKNKRAGQSYCLCSLNMQICDVPLLLPPRHLLIAIATIKFKMAAKVVH